MMSTPASPSRRAISTASSGVMPSVADPVVGGNADRDRLRRRPDRPHGMIDLERKAHAVLERAAVRVGAAVGQRRDERRQQIAVRTVQLEQIEAGARGHVRRPHELVPHRVHVGARHLARHLIARRPRDRRRADDRPVVLRPAAHPRLPSRAASILSALNVRAACRSWRRSPRGRNRRCASTRASCSGA